MTVARLNPAGMSTALCAAWSIVNPRIETKFAPIWKLSTIEFLLVSVHRMPDSSAHAAIDTIRGV